MIARRIRLIVPWIAVAGLASCAGVPRRAPDHAEAPREEAAPGETAAPSSVREADASVATLRESLGQASADQQSTWRLRIARVQEVSGRDAAARAEYAWATGSPRRDEAAEAWDGIARLRRLAKDDEGAVLAEIEAWLASPSGDRAAALDRSTGSLAPGAARRLARTVPGAPLEPLGADLARRSAPAGLTIALLVPLTGRFESFGHAFRTGAEIALEQRSRESAGAPAIRILVEDTAGDLRQASEAARRAVLEEDATVLLGPLLSVPAIGAGAIAETFGTPLVAPTATDPEVGKIGPHVLTLEPSARLLAEPLARAAVEGFGAMRFGALVAQTSAAEEREREFRAAIERHGAELAVSVSYVPDERDFRKLLEKLSDASVDAVYIPGDAPELEALVPQLEFYGFGARVLGHGGWMSNRVLQPKGSVLEGALFAVESAEDPSSPVAKALHEAVRSRENAEPTRFHTEGYRAMAAVLFAIDRGATTREALTESLRSRAGWSECPEGERVRLLTMRAGALEPLEEPVAAPADAPQSGG